jgi:hypothetical protein
MVGVRILHVYAHLMFRAVLYGFDDECIKLGLLRYYDNYMVWSIICVHLNFYELDLIV